MTFSPLANPKTTKLVLQQHGHYAKHALGQNFLIDDGVIGNILRLSDLEAVSSGRPRESVLEIGPGIGTLTVALLERVNVIAIERDGDLVAVLEETTAELSHRFALIEKDALKVSREEIEQAVLAIKASMPDQLVANLPYGIAATVVLDWLERFDFIDAMTVMVQSEVADRMCAKVGTKEYGAYTVKLDLYAHVEDRFQVPSGCFMPAPHVESAVVRIERNAEAVDGELLRTACKLADAAFAQRRKTIRNSMQSKFPKDVVDRLLEACDISPTARGETLSPSTYLRMAEEYLAISR